LPDELKYWKHDNREGDFCVFVSFAEVNSVFQSIAFIVFIVWCCNPWYYIL